VIWNVYKYPYTYIYIIHNIHDFFLIFFFSHTYVGGGDSEEEDDIMKEMMDEIKAKVPPTYFSRDSKRALYISYVYPKEPYIK